MGGEQQGEKGITPGVAPLVQKAIADLARRLSLEPDEIAVLEARAVVWPDTSLGCPQPGMRYPQIPQDGVLIRLSAGGQSYSYHGGGTREPFLCERMVRPRKTSPPRLDDLVPRPDRRSD